MFARLTVICCALLLAACGTKPDPVTEPKVNLGDFRMVLNTAVTTTATKMGVSRTATPEEWEPVLEDAIDARFARYDGPKPYFLSYSLDGYILATKGGRLVLAPRSALVATVHVWDAETKTRLKDRSKQLFVLEQFDGETAIGSGLFRTKEQQMSNLAAQFAKAVERWLVANGDLFGVDVDPEAKKAAEADDLAKAADALQAPATEGGTN